MKVITISGKAQNGKDTTAGLLKAALEADGYKVLITHYADLLKYICKQFFGWDGQKDDAGRHILQYVGTDIIRQKRPDYWVGFVTSILELFPNEWDYVLIPDCRFPNEIDYLKEAGLDTVNLRVVRKNFKSPLTPEQQAHPSETALDDVEPDYYITNNGSMTDLKRNHNLIYRQQESGKMELHITTPKTRAGTRIIPMFSDVRAALLQIRLKHMEEGFNECEVDGYTNFIFKNRFGEMLNPHVINRALERIIRDCNAEETERAEQEHREPVLLPHFSAHNLRHTFCTRLCENETNLKVIQEIMGHRNIETTMDVYNEATKEKKMSSFANLEGKIRVS